MNFESERDCDAGVKSAGCPASVGQPEYTKLHLVTEIPNHDLRTQDHEVGERTLAVICICSKGASHRRASDPDSADHSAQNWVLEHELNSPSEQGLGIVARGIFRQVAEDQIENYTADWSNRDVGRARVLKGTRFGEEPSDSFIDVRDSSDTGTVEHNRQVGEVVNAHTQWRVQPMMYHRVPKSSCWPIRQPKPTHSYFVHDYAASSGTDVSSRKRILTKIAAPSCPISRTQQTRMGSKNQDTNGNLQTPPSEYKVSPLRDALETQSWSGHDGHGTARSSGRQDRPGAAVKTDQYTDDQTPNSQLSGSPRHAPHHSNRLKTYATPMRDTRIQAVKV